MRRDKGASPLGSLGISADCSTASRRNSLGARLCVEPQATLPMRRVRSRVLLPHAGFTCLAHTLDFLLYLLSDCRRCDFRSIAATVRHMTATPPNHAPQRTR